MTEVIGPDTVVAAYLRYPLVMPDGRAIYQVEVAGGRYGGNEMPSVRDADGRPVELREEIGAGSVVMLALADGELRAVKLLAPVWDDPFED